MLSGLAAGMCVVRVVPASLVPAAGEDVPLLARPVIGVAGRAVLVPLSSFLPLLSLPLLWLMLLLGHQPHSSISLFRDDVM